MLTFSLDLSPPQRSEVDRHWRRSEVDCHLIERRESSQRVNIGIHTKTGEQIADENHALIHFSANKVGPLYVEFIRVSLDRISRYAKLRTRREVLFNKNGWIYPLIKNRK
jgi:hypothetical protein